MCLKVRHSYKGKVWKCRACRTIIFSLLCQTISASFAIKALARFPVKSSFNTQNTMMDQFVGTKLFWSLWRKFLISFCGKKSSSKSTYNFHVLLGWRKIGEKKNFQSSFWTMKIYFKNFKAVNFSRNFELKVSKLTEALFDTKSFDNLKLFVHFSQLVCVRFLKDQFHSHSLCTFSEPIESDYMISTSTAWN